MILTHYVIDHMDNEVFSRDVHVLSTASVVLIYYCYFTGSSVFLELSSILSPH
jgi:hypothetical protein